MPQQASTKPRKKILCGSRQTLQHLPILLLEALNKKLKDLILYPQHDQLFNMASYEYESDDQECNKQIEKWRKEYERLQQTCLNDNRNLQKTMDKEILACENAKLQLQVQLNELDLKFFHLDKLRSRKQELKDTLKLQANTSTNQSNQSTYNPATLKDLEDELKSLSQEVDQLQGQAETLQDQDDKLDEAIEQQKQLLRSFQPRRNLMGGTLVEEAAALQAVLDTCQSQMQGTVNNAIAQAEEQCKKLIEAQVAEQNQRIHALREELNLLQTTAGAYMQ